MLCSVMRCTYVCPSRTRDPGHQEIPESDGEKTPGARPEHNERWLMEPIGSMSQHTQC